MLQQHVSPKSWKIRTTFDELTKLLMETDQGRKRKSIKWCMQGNGARAAFCASSHFPPWQTKKKEAKISDVSSTSGKGEAPSFPHVFMKIMPDRGPWRLL